MVKFSFPGSLKYKWPRNFLSSLVYSGSEITSIWSLFQMQATCLQRLCVMEGIDEWKIDHSLRVDGSGSVPGK